MLSVDLLMVLGLKPFEKVPMTEDNTEIDFYKVLDIDPDVGVIIPL